MITDLFNDSDAPFPCAYERDCDGIMFETEHLDKPHFEGPIWLSHVALVSPDISTPKEKGLAVEVASQHLETDLNLAQPPPS